MLGSRLYRPENVQRIETLCTVIIVAAVAISTYAIALLVIDCQRMHNSRVGLDKATNERAQLNEQSTHAEQALATTSPTGNGGLEPLAVRISGWAKNHNIQLESLIPQGDARISDIKLASAVVGRWAQRNIQIKGRGDLGQVMSLLDQMCDPSLMPLQLNSFSLASTDEGKSGNVAFCFSLTVYERKEK